LNYLEQYSVPVRGITEGVHNFEFDISKKFFEHFNVLDVKNANLKTYVELTYKNGNYTFKIKITGFVLLICDVCLDEYKQNVFAEHILYANENNNNDSKFDDNIINISDISNKINISNHIYEFIVLSIPVKHQHPLDDKGNRTCNAEMLKRLESYSIINEQNNIDPRWEKLKNLKNGTS